MECQHGSHHQFADLNVLEFLPLDDADKNLQAVVVTPLENEAMPMFRYRNGDSARAVPGDCPCGRQLPLMSSCYGRICNNMLAPDGRLVNGTYFTDFLLYQEGFKAWQFHQTSITDIDLYVVPDGQVTDDGREHLKKCVDKIGHDFGGQFKVNVHIVTSIPRTSSGKHLYIFSDVLKNM
jgi:phenylacetate-CoA ligase